ncbi:MAG: hypothetical protein AAFW73_25780 [Bacteroidota bacterium]
MKTKTLLLLLLLTQLACVKDDPIVIKEVEKFSEAHFTIFDSSPLRAEAAELRPDGSLFIVGVGSANKDLTRNPFFLHLNSSHEPTSLKLIDYGDRFVYPVMDLIPSQDGHFIYLNQSIFEPDLEANIDLRKVTESGEILWEKRLAESSFRQQWPSLIELPNNDFLVIMNNWERSYLSKNFLIKCFTTDGEELWSKEVEDDVVLITRKSFYLPVDESILILAEVLDVDTEQWSSQLFKLDLEGNLIDTKDVMDCNTIGFGSIDVKLLDDETILLYYRTAEGVIISQFTSDLMEKSTIVFDESIVSSPADVVKVSDGSLVVLTTGYDSNEDIDNHVFLTKINCGEVLWKKRYGSPRSDAGVALVERPNGNLVLIGRTQQDVEVGGTFNLFLVETDAEGNPN